MFFWIKCLYQANKVYLFCYLILNCSESGFFLSFYYIKLIYRNETVYACLKQNYLLNAFQKCMALRTVVNHNTIALSLSQLYFNWSNKLPQNIFIFNQFSPEEIMKMPDIRTINPSSSIRKSSSFIHFTFHKHR